ncbi:Unknown protein, partial [Striga hermonthica]
KIQEARRPDEAGKRAKTTHAWPKRRVRACMRDNQARGKRHVQGNRQGRAHAQWRRRAWRLEIRQSGAQGKVVGWMAREGDCYGQMNAGASQQRASGLDARNWPSDRARNTRAIGARVEERDEERTRVVLGVRGCTAVEQAAGMPPRREPAQLAVPQATVVAQFRNYHPEKFFGQGDPRIVDEWIQGLELIFEVMDCPDHYRVICAQLQLTGDARLWWNAYWSMRSGEKEGCTWERFKELIREKYYPTYYRAEMERQFLSLKKGTRSVDEYEREFTRLAAFIPDLVRTEAQRAQRFIDGLYPAVRHNIVGHGTQTYARADIFYYCHEPGHFVSRCPKKFQQQPQQPQPPPQQPRQQQQHPRQQDQRPPQQQQRGRQQARVYAVDQAEAEQQPGTMSGMLILNDVPVFALFDTGATHSFISRRCLDTIGVHAFTAVDPLEVSLASGRRIVITAKASDLSLSIGGRILSTDTYVLEMRDFDLIFGMDWLSYYHADIRYHDREITLYLPGDDLITFFGTKNRSLPHVVSMAKATKMLRRSKCQGYLVSLVDESQKARTPHDVPVVREFVDVFPDELPGGPPNRQVEFSIDLIPGAGPISKAPYHMAPKELQELKAQIQELLRL